MWVEVNTGYNYHETTKLGLCYYEHSYQLPYIGKTMEIVLFRYIVCFTYVDNWTKYKEFKKAYQTKRLLWRKKIGLDKD